MNQPSTLSIKRLNELQELDLAIDARERSLSEVRAKLADESAVVSARCRLEELDSSLADRATARRRLEPSLREVEDKLQAAERRLYGGVITNPRELAALEGERSFLRGQKSAEEDKVLEVMVEVEDLQSARMEAYAHLARLEAERAVELTHLSEVEQRTEGELHELRQTRDNVAPQIPPSALSVYESLRQTRNGHAVARVERGMCQGCRLALSTMELQRARSSQGIIQCSSCRRILYLA